jgi:hypothetical protein
MSATQNVTVPNQLGENLPPSVQKLVVEYSKKSASRKCIQQALEAKLVTIESEIMGDTLPPDLLNSATKRFPKNEIQAKAFAKFLAESNKEAITNKLVKAKEDNTAVYAELIHIVGQTLASIKLDPNLAGQMVSGFHLHQTKLFIAQFTIKIEQDKLKKAAKLLKLNEQKERDLEPKVLSTKEYNKLIKNVQGSKPTKVSGSKSKPKEKQTSKGKSANSKRKLTAKGKK